ncbi:hypothetical protein BCR32DRAFT_324757 [Anaeromyces robustus]|uniref:DUF4832 domain-containing protein n=1 Tax=Anaeromyces robustus TaxID=1754192 RepID=A0A1Y1XMJ8_9FUNG|nr:hypothetical protein BCR32DRAFT_324757 [Anaeromyces robustus]|eukprot:ORX86933.1 hypothetical protein BCR32DRAFT_324757 [Anaeromyces robustus]
MKFIIITLLALLLLNINNIKVKGKPANDYFLNINNSNNVENVIEKIVKRANTGSNFQSVKYINYEESLKEVDNPYRGFYQEMETKLSPSGGNVKNYPETSLIRLLVDLSPFSKVKNNQQDMELTKEALVLFEDVLKTLVKSQKTAVIRFAYHPGFNSDNHTYEPSMKFLLKHQEQLGAIMSKYTEVIAVVECGMLGMYGEMHSSFVYDDKDTFYQNTVLVINKWLEVLPQNLTLSVRKPKFYCHWKGIDLNSIDKDLTTVKDKSYRVGIYNDGYFASNGDLGTYTNRNKEVKWLYNQAKHTVFGGEFGRPDEDSTYNISFNDMVSEMFITHTSYLNSGFYKGTLKKIKNSKYNGSDKKYVGQNGMIYVQNHLGYRFVVKDVSITKSIGKNESFGIIVKINNVGFGNLVTPKEPIILLKNSNTNNIYKFPLLSDKTVQKEIVENINPNQWESNATYNFKAVFKLPNNISTGNYKVYLRLASNKDSKGTNGYPIRFANDDNKIWDYDLGANYLADFTITNTNTNNKNNNNNNNNNSVGSINRNPNNKNVNNNPNNNASPTTTILSPVIPRITTKLTSRISTKTIPKTTTISKPTSISTPRVGNGNANNNNNSSTPSQNYYKYAIKFRGTLSNQENYYLGARDLKTYDFFKLSKKDDSTKSGIYRTWHVNSIKEPSLFYLSDSLYGSGDGKPTNYCLDIGYYVTMKGYNYLSIVECSKAKYKFKYGGTYKDTIDIYYRSNNKHITDRKGNNLCLYYSVIPHIAKCSDYESKENLRWTRYIMD